jgi:tetratricopeptide (TPR) repeat protein
VTRRLTFVIAVLLTAVAHPTLSEVALAQIPRAESPGGRVSLDEARRLTWRRETRAAGVVALRRLASGGPEAVNAQFELGRVLTWDVATRAEGIALLRQATEEVPAPADAEEALAEVLTWDTSTRAEGVMRLRRLQEQQPTRVSVRVKLADVLSWNPATRDEAESLYRSVLQTDGSSVEAVVGLARLLSWQGRFSESRAAYRQALTRDPGGSAALMGLAQLDGWSGRARAALSRLSAAPDQTAETPDAYQLRAQAYTQIGRPAKALREYDALLALRPGDQAVTRASQAARQSVRPVLEIGADASDQSGDAATSKVATSSMPIRLSFHPRGQDAEISLNASWARYRNSIGSSRDASFGGGFDTPVGNRVRVRGEAANHEFAEARRAVTGRGEVLVTPHDRVEFRVGASREQLFSSRLSLSGEERGGIFYGPSLANEFFAGATLHPAAGWDVWARAIEGRTRGENIPRNTHEKVFAGGGRSFRTGQATLRTGYALTWMAYQRDLGGFPSTNVGGDGTNTRGIGGYFSPFRFINHALRVDTTLPFGESFLIVGGASIGRQQVKDATTGGRAPSSTSSDGYLGFRIPAGDRVAVRGQIDYQNVASAFNRMTLRLTLAYGF